MAPTKFRKRSFAASYITYGEHMRLHYADYWHIHHRKSLRLKGYDYSGPGLYYVTICVAGRECLLGDVVDGRVVPNAFGRFAETALLWLTKQYPYVEIDTYVIMPNHLHVIVCIREGGSRGRGDSRIAPTAATQTSLARKSLGRLIGAFKTVSTKWINLLRNAPAERFWQRNYHERIIRSGEDLERIRTYIHENPRNWDKDKNDVHPL